MARSNSYLKEMCDNEMTREFIIHKIQTFTDRLIEGDLEEEFTDEEDIKEALLFLCYLLKEHTLPCWVSYSC